MSRPLCRVEDEEYIESLQPTVGEQSSGSGQRVLTWTPHPSPYEWGTASGVSLGMTQRKKQKESDCFQSHISAVFIRFGDENNSFPRVGKYVIFKGARNEQILL